MEESTEARSTAEAKAGRPEPIGCSSTTEPQPTALTPNGRADRLEDSDGKHAGTQSSLLEQILSRENMLAAWKRVKANKVGHWGQRKRRDKPAWDKE